MNVPEHTHQALPPGTLIEHFRIEAVLGKGGFGITYLAVDSQLRKKVAIKELLPDTIATRVDGSTVVHHSPSMAENWQWARERFLDEARTLAGFSHPAIVGVHRLIETNGTVYLVMDFVEGESYEARLRRIGKEPDQASLMTVIGPILEGLQEVHAKGLLHRDIKPDNILINQRGQPVLIDFGSARSSIGATMTMTSIVTHGYSPAEQYQTKGRMGPWTDIYAVAAVMCRAITGEKPPVASDRIMEEDFEWLSYRGLQGYSEQFLLAVDWALRVRPEERPKSVLEWRQTFGTLSTAAHAAEVSASGRDSHGSQTPGLAQQVANSIDEVEDIAPLNIYAQSANSGESEDTPIPTGSSSKAPTKQRSSKGLWIGVVVVAVLIMAVAGAVVISNEIQAEAARFEAEQQRQAEAARLAEEQRLAEASAAKEAKHLAEKQRQGKAAAEIAKRLAEKQRLAEEAATEEAKRLAEEQQRIAEEAGKKSPSAATKENPYANILGMQFVPVLGTDVLFSIWETRVQDYEAYAKENPIVDGSWRDPGFDQGDDHPVVNVSWEDAKAFCAWLTKTERAAGRLQPDQEYRLPTDAEWSTAVGLGRESGSTPNEKNEKASGYPWGNQWPPPRGAGNYASSLGTDDFQYTSPVGSFAPNQYGIYDLGGNVWEWCLDSYHGSSSPSAARVLRGASWDLDYPRYLLSSYRISLTPTGRILNRGFRCVLASSESAR